MHALQALQGLEVELFAAHREVFGLYERQAQVAREVGVLEVGFVVGAGREQGDVRRFALGHRAAGLEAFDQGLVGGGQALHGQRFKGFGEQARDDEAVFEQIAQTRGRLRALREQPPQAIGPAREVEGRQAQVAPAHRFGTVHGVQVARVALQQRRGQEAARNQALRAVGILHDVLEQLHALAHATLDLLPGFGPDHQREEVERPGALGLLGLGVDVVGDAVVVHLAAQVGHALVQPGQALRAEPLDEVRPQQTGRVPFVCCRTQAVAQFVPMALGRRLRVCTPPAHGVGLVVGVDRRNRDIGHAPIVAAKTRSTLIGANPG